MGRTRESLESGAGKVLDYSKQCLRSHSGRSLEDKQVETKTDSAGPSHEASEWKMDSMRNWAKGCKCYMFSSEGKRFPQWKCYSSEWKGILATGNQGIPQRHTTRQTSHKRFIGKTTKE